MNTGLISTRYATALLDYAADQGEQEKVYAEVKMLVRMFQQVSRFGKVLEDVSVRNSEKRKLIHTAAGGEISHSMAQFVELLLKNKREDRLYNICLRYLELYRKKYSILRGTLTTATKVDKATYDRLKAFIEHKSGETLELERTIDPDILGGFVLQIGDDRIDASVSGQLKRIKTDLTSKMRKSG